MKKVITLCLIAAIVAAIPAYAGDEDLLARIEALEERVAALEALHAGSIQGDQAQTAVATGDPITLEVGTWIVGEDIPAGRYNLTSATDAGAQCMVYKSLDEKMNDGIFDDYYSVSTDAYKEMYASLFEDQEGLSATLDSMPTEIFNVYLSDGQCLEIEGSALIFSPS